MFLTFMLKMTVHFAHYWNFNHFWHYFGHFLHDFGHFLGDVGPDFGDFRGDFSKPFWAFDLRVRRLPFLYSIFKSCICAWEFHTEWRNPRRIWLIMSHVSIKTWHFNKNVKTSKVAGSHKNAEGIAKPKDKRVLTQCDWGRAPHAHALDGSEQTKCLTFAWRITISYMPVHFERTVFPCLFWDRPQNRVSLSRHRLCQGYRICNCK